MKTDFPSTIETLGYNNIIMATSTDILSEEAMAQLAIDVECHVDTVKKAIAIAKKLDQLDTSIKWYTVYETMWLPENTFDSPHEIQTMLQVFAHMNINRANVDRFYAAITQQALDLTKFDLFFRSNAKILPEMEETLQQWRQELHLLIKKLQNNMVHASSYASSQCAIDTYIDIIFGKLPEKLTEWVADAIASSGLVCRMKLYRERGGVWTMNTMNYAARGGHLDLIRYLRENDFTWDERTIGSAALYGHLDLIRYMRENDPASPCPWNAESFWMAVIFGNLECMKYMRQGDNPCPWNEYANQLAAENGDLKSLKWLHEGGPVPCPRSRYMIVMGVRSNQLEVVKYLHETGCPWMGGECEEAARQGNLDILKYLHENGAPWNVHACSEAAKYNRLDILQYLHKNGCPLSNRAFYNALSHFECLKYLVKNGCEWDPRWIYTPECTPECRQYLKDNATVDQWPLNVR